MTPRTSPPNAASIRLRVWSSCSALANSWALGYREDGVEILPVEVDVGGFVFKTEMLARDHGDVADVPDEVALVARF